jgi:hypothetical protein
MLAKVEAVGDGGEVRFGSIADVAGVCQRRHPHKRRTGTACVSVGRVPQESCSVKVVARACNQLYSGLTEVEEVQKLIHQSAIFFACWSCPPRFSTLGSAAYRIQPSLHSGKGITRGERSRPGFPDFRRCEAPGG